MTLDDQQALAGLARTMLASASEAAVVRLLDHAVERVVVFDDDGEPVLVSRPDGVVTISASGSSPLRVVVAQSAVAGDAILTLVGRVESIPPAADGSRPDAQFGAAEQVAAATGAMITRLSVERVFLGGARDLRVEVALGDYAMATADAPAAYGPRLLQHTNRCHAASLRRLAAEVADIHAHGVLAATLSELGEHGVELAWLDADGWWSASLPFHHRVASLGELSCAMRALLHDRGAGREPQCSRADCTARHRLDLPVPNRAVPNLPLPDRPVLGRARRRMSERAD